MTRGRLLLGIIAAGTLITSCSGQLTNPSPPTAPAAPQTSANSSLTAPATIQLTGGTLQLYSGDPGTADLVAPGFEVKSMAGGSWPVTVSPGSLVNFSTGITLSNWGPATVNGAQVPGDPVGPGTGRVWIRGNLQIAATPFVALSPSAFGDGLQTTVRVTGTVTGFFNNSPDAPMLFTTNVSGTGTVSGAYRVVMNGSDPLYVDNCCVRIAIDAQ